MKPILKTNEKEGQKEHYQISKEHGTATLNMKTSTLKTKVKKHIIFTTFL
jgi:hypothetical protein